MNGRSHRYGAPRWYRASRRSTLLRLVIPAALGITVAGLAIGAAVAYFADGGGGPQSPAIARSASRHAPPTTRHVHTARSGVARPSAGTSAPPAQSTLEPATSAAGHRLNDAGYALIRRGDFAGAITPLREAVRDLA